MAHLVSKGDRPRSSVWVQGCRGAGGVCACVPHGQRALLWCWGPATPNPMPVAAADLPAIEAALHTGAPTVALADGTSLKLKKARPKANGGRGLWSVTGTLAAPPGRPVQLNEHDRSKTSEWTSLAKAGHRVTWVLAGVFPHRSAVAMVDGCLTKAVDDLPGAPVKDAPLTSAAKAEASGAGDAAATGAAAPSPISCSVAEAVLVHEGLHGTATSLSVGGDTVAVELKSPSKERFCRFRGVVFRQQSANNSSGGKEVCVPRSAARLTLISWGLRITVSLCHFATARAHRDCWSPPGEGPGQGLKLLLCAWHAIPGPRQRFGHCQTQAARHTHVRQPQRLGNGHNSAAHSAPNRIPGAILEKGLTGP